VPADRTEGDRLNGRVLGLHFIGIGMREIAEPDVFPTVIEPRRFGQKFVRRLFEDDICQPRNA
jgi:hypothetical protein